MLAETPPYLLCDNQTIQFHQENALYSNHFHKSQSKHLMQVVELFLSCSFCDGDSTGETRAHKTYFFHVLIPSYNEKLQGGQKIQMSKHRDAWRIGQHNFEKSPALMYSKDSRHTFENSPAYIISSKFSILFVHVYQGNLEIFHHKHNRRETLHDIEYHQF